MTGGRPPAPLHERLFEIDLLRFIAALSVVFYHWAFRGHAADGLTRLSYPEISAVAQYGYLGVELFFVISGFVILMSARSGSLRDFAVSRFVRLYPAFWVSCTITFAGLTLLNSGHPDLRPGFWQYLMNLTMMSGFFDVASVDGAYWSLFVEMRFYLMVAIVLALGWMPHAERLLWAWFAAVLLLIALRSGRLAVLFNVPHAALFIAGALLYLVHEGGWTASRALLLLCSWVLAMVQQLQGLAVHAEHYRTEYSSWVVGGVISSIFVVMGCVATGNLRFLRRRSWLPLGAMTYPLYLLHQYLGYAGFDRLLPFADRRLIFWMSLAAVLVLAFAVQHWIETPLARSLKRALRRKPALP